jgi:hypothetical protein
MLIAIYYHFPYIERRRFLAATATVTAVGVAGCAEPDDEGDDNSGGYTLTKPTQEEPPERSVDMK